MLNLNESFKALSLSVEPEILNSSKYNFNANEKGRSMIEMLGVLAIIGVLSVGGIAGYSKAMLKYKTNKTIDQITMLTTNIRTLYAQQDTFNGLTVATALNMGVVPDEMDNGDSTLINPFSGPVTIVAGNSVPGDAGTNRAFVIGVDGIPKEACMAIATSDWGSNYSSGMIGMAVTGSYTAASSGTAASGAASGKLATIYAGSDCANGGSAGTLEATNNDTKGAICAKFMPIQVANASSACSCAGSQCSVAFKYY